MKRNLLTAMLLFVAGIQAVKSQKIVLHMAGNQTFECSISQLDSITFVGDDLIIEEEHEWVDLGLPSGTLWATCNIGANSPEEYGDYFAWGETKPKEKYTWDTYIYYAGLNDIGETMTKYCTDGNFGYNGFTDNMTELLPEDDAATINWGNGWQMPDVEQCRELINEEYTNTLWTTQNGVNGRLITSKSNNNSIFLPAAGYNGETAIYETGRLGAYWSRSLVARYSASGSYDLLFHQNEIFISGGQRYAGATVRPVCVMTR